MYKSDDLLKVESWRELMTYAEDNDFWISRVRCMNQQPVVKIVKHVEDEREKPAATMMIAPKNSAEIPSADCAPHAPRR